MFESTHLFSHEIEELLEEGLKKSPGVRMLGRFRSVIGFISSMTFTGFMLALVILGALALFGYTLWRWVWPGAKTVAALHFAFGIFQVFRASWEIKKLEEEYQLINQARYCVAFWEEHMGGLTPNTYDPKQRVRVKRWLKDAHHGPVKIDRPVLYSRMMTEIYSRANKAVNVV